MAAGNLKISNDFLSFSASIAAFSHAFLKPEKDKANRLIWHIKYLHGIGPCVVLQDRLADRLCGRYLPAYFAMLYLPHLHRKIAADEAASQIGDSLTVGGKVYAGKYLANGTSTMPLPDMGGI